MKYLAIDTSGKSLIVIVDNGNTPLTFCDADCGVKHSTALMPKVEELLERAGVSVSDLDFVAVVVGAGSFTGIRIGVSTAKALCFAFDKPCLAITSFDSLAYNKTEGNTLAVLDAGHGGYYACGYNCAKVSVPPAYILKEELFALAESYTVVSDKQIEGLNVVVGDQVKGLALAVADKAGLATDNLDDIAPLYVRKSQAEEGRP